MKIEEKEKLCEIRLDKKAKILTNRANIATKEILCECEETLEIMTEVLCAGSYIVTEKLNGKPKKFTNRRVNTKPRGKESIEKEINELRREALIFDELIRGVKLKSRMLNRKNKKYKMRKLDDLTPLKEILKQKIQLKAQRMKRCEKKHEIVQTEQHF